MKLRCVEIMTGFALLVLSGCDGPGPIVPIAPPGANIPRVSPDSGPAEAQGEAVSETQSSAPPSTVSAAYKPAPPTAVGETKVTERGVKYETLKEGTGPVLKRGQRASFHYEGRLAADNTVFEESRSKNQPLSSRLGGAPPLIEGWEEASRNESRRNPQAHDPARAGIQGGGPPAQDSAQRNPDLRDRAAQHCGRGMRKERN